MGDDVERSFCYDKVTKYAGLYENGVWREDMKRRLTAILLSFCMVLTMTPAIVFADGMDVEKIGITKENLSVSVHSELYTGEPIEPEAY